MLPEAAQTGSASLEAVLAALLESLEQGQSPDQEEWTSRFPQFAVELEQFFRSWAHFQPWAAPLRSMARGLVPTPRPEGDTPPRESPGAVFAEERLPDSLPDFELLEEIGRGGMGVVYKARQKSLNRLVALKMIRAAGPMAEADLRRFWNEAKAVANLDHPHIVPLYEIGEHDGLRYFTMKLIEGGSLIRHLDVFLTDSHAAARLTAQVARAVHQAHQRGILHRDLKPSNILVDDQGRPYVTDFGLAKHMAVDSSLTLSGQLVGTPSYMAPEQAGGKQAWTTAADVYGLGAILYVLLAGKPPFRGETILDTLQQVKELEPERPRAANPRVPRDLETICLKCLRKDPDVRYESAEALADDLDAFLAGDPIRARPPTQLALLARWCRQHKPLVTASGAILLSVLVLGWIGPQQQRIAAEKTVVESLGDQGTFDFGQDVVTVPAEQMGWPLQEQSKTVQSQDAIEKALRLKGSGTPNYGELGEGYLALHRFTEAEEAFRNLIAQGPEDAYAYRNLGYALFGQGKLGAAIAAYERAVFLKADDAYAFNGLGLALARDGKAPGAIAAFGKASDIRPRWAAPYYNLGSILVAQWDLPKAIAAYEKAIGLKPDAAGAYVNLGIALDRQRKLPEAIAAYESAIALDPNIFQAYANLGLALYHQGKRTEAIAAFQKTIGLNPKLGLPYKTIGHIHYEMGNLADAVAWYRKAISIGSESGRAYRSLGFALQEQGNFAEGLAELRKGYEDESGFVFAARVAEGEQLVLLGDKVLRIVKKVIQPESSATRATMAQWCQRKSQKRYALAARFYSEAFAADPTLAHDSRNERRYSAARAAALAACGEGRDAAELEAGTRVRLRQQALAWLQADLAGWRQLFKEYAEAPVTVSRYMVGWLGDNAFDGIRGGVALERLPEVERQHWQSFWRDVEELLKDATELQNPATSK